MSAIDTIYILVGLNIFQAYQIWKIDRKTEAAIDLIVGLHLGRLTLTEADDDEY